MRVYLDRMLKVKPVSSLETDHQMSEMRIKSYIFLLTVLMMQPTSSSAQTAPSDTIVTPLTTTSISVSWTVNSTDHDGFVIQRRTGTVGPFSNEFGADRPPYIDTEDVEIGAVFCYRVRAVKAGVRSGPSNTVCTEVPDLANEPSGLRGAQVSENAVVALTWDDNSNNESEFVVYRSDQGGVSQEIGRARQNATSFSDRSTFNSTTYSYVVRAANAAGESGDSNTLDVAVTIGDVMLPGNIEALSASESSIRLSWNFDIFNYESLAVDRRIAGTNTWNEVTILNEFATEYLDENLSQNTTYCYRLRVENENGSDSTTQDICGMTEFGVPDAPTALIVGGRSVTTIAVSWESEDLVGHQYRLERNRNSGGFSVIQDNLDERDFLDSELDFAATYCYRVKVFNPQHVSSYSPTACGIVTPPEVRNFNATLNPNNTTSQIDLSWTAPPNQIVVTYQIAFGPEGTEPQTLETGDNTFSLTDLVDGTRYVIHVNSYRQRGAFESSSDVASAVLSTYMIFWPGDTNNDGVVNTTDLIQLTSLECFGMPTSFSSDGSSVSWQLIDVEVEDENPVPLRCDTDRDGEVTVFDALAIIVNAGLTTGADREDETIALAISSDDQFEILSEIYSLIDSGNAARIEMKEELQGLLAEYSEIEDLPSQTGMSANYPNPFTEITKVQVDLAEDAHALMQVFDIQGQLILTIQDGELRQGSSIQEIDLAKKPAGTYLLRLTINHSTVYNKVLSKSGSAN